MPIFEYKCGECGKVSKFLEAGGSRRARSCVHCGGKKLEKQFSVFASQVKAGESKKCLGCTDNTCPHSQR